ncbi:uncharacterized protein E0L32_005654 [Thyridium curvatum]|uniref:CENP-T/Histone H4 histone fold domain-containing protein n=1 Tax=Thyridium curvatum TaxID=1093900 RepID=A0A507B5H3_9PEZI|nr:uncharacterized protein E0L32_005654 [Thyridium curvatum]TPX13954.1 hypothetical protein E0L32_005654 [Thyridium curvatum]
MPTTPSRAETAQPTAAGASTPRSAQRRPALTPLVSRARSAEPPSSRRSVHTPATGGARAPGSTTRQGLSASGRKTNAAAAATPHARAAFRALDSRRAAIFTPGKSRRRSLREQRETPRDILRNLSRVLAPTTRPAASSSSSPGPKMASDIGTILEDDEDDDFPIDRPRLSLPIDMDDDSDLQPHHSAFMEDENFTMQSIELPRRALSEQPPRLSRSSLGSVRLSDYMGGNDLGSDDDVGIDSAFFPAGPFDDIPEEEAIGDMTYERIDDGAGRRATFLAGRESEFGVIDAPVNANDSTVFLAPQLQSSPVRPSFHPEEQMVVDDDNPFGEEEEGGDGAEGGVMDATGLEDLQVEEATAKDAAWKGKKKKRGVKVSKFGVEYPSLPPSVVKRLAQTFAQTSGVGKAKISPDTLNTIMQASDWFFEQLGDDLQAYAKHAGRKTIDESDMLTLMRRQRQTSSVTTPFSLAQRHLPRELLQELRMTPPAPVKQRRRRNVSGGAEIT